MYPVIKWFWDRIYYLCGARLLCYCGGMYLAKFQIISKAKYIFAKQRYHNFMIYTILFISSLILIILNSGLLIVLFSFVVFICFNSLYKNKTSVNILSILGEYSIFIWFIHPFIYSGIFECITRLWLKLYYAIPLFIGLLVLSLIIAIPLNYISTQLIKKCYDILKAYLHITNCIIRNSLVHYIK